MHINVYLSSSAARAHKNFKIPMEYAEVIAVLEPERAIRTDNSFLLFCL